MECFHRSQRSLWSRLAALFISKQKGSRQSEVKKFREHWWSRHGAVKKDCSALFHPGRLPSSATLVTAAIKSLIFPINKLSSFDLRLSYLLAGEIGHLSTRLWILIMFFFSLSCQNYLFWGFFLFAIVFPLLLFFCSMILWNIIFRYFFLFKA